MLGSDRGRADDHLRAVRLEHVALASATCSRRTAPRWSSARPRSRPSTRTPTTTSRDRLVAASRAPGSPTSTPTRTTRAPTTRPPARRSGSRPRAGSPTSSCGIGTGGTISGVGRYLKEQNPDVQVIGADPAGSVYSGGTGRPYLVEGVGEDFWPETYDRDDRRPDHRGLRRRLVRVHPPAGPRGGAAGRRLVRHGGVRRAPGRPRARRTPEGDDAVIVVLLPDSGRGYLTKVFNDEWLAQYGFADRRRATDQTVGEVLRGKGGRLPDLVHTHPSETIAEAVHDPPGVRRLADARGPRRAADRGGRGGRLGLRAHPARRALRRRRPPHRPGRGPHVAAAADDRLDGVRPATRSRCSRTPTRVLVQEDGKPVGVLTRQDLLAFLAGA